MSEKIIELIPKQVNFINGINQVVKKSFLRYFIVRNGVIFTDDKGSVITSGNHFSFMEEIERFMEILPIPEKHAVMLLSDKIYHHIKNYKKHIKYIRIKDDYIYFAGETEDVVIGRYIELNQKAMEHYSNASTRIMNKSDVIISDSIIDSLLKNEVVTYGSDEYRVRLTKTLIPHIKKGLPITISFMDVEDENLFQIMISITKDKVTNFHVFTCIKF